MFIHFIKKDPKLFLEISLFVIKMSVAKKLFSLEHVLKMVKPKKTFKLQNKWKFLDNLRSITSYFLGNGFFGKKNCYDVALVYYHFLNKAGIPAKINFGIKPEKLTNPINAGHLWVTIGGKEFPEHDFASSKEYSTVFSF